jgi:putative RNA 2'-phosphotransferase
MSNLTQQSKFLSLILRHDPSKIGITLDQNGWANVQDLIFKMPINLETLKKIVSIDSKQRYSFSEDGSKIRANQGHSIDVDIQLKPIQPPAILYHGTAKKFVPDIMKYGLKPMSRQYVHLSDNYDTALQVGARHGDPTVLSIDTGIAHTNNIEFYISENNIWLSKFIDPKYINEILVLDSIG